MSPFRRSDPPLLEVLALAFFAAVLWDIFFGVPTPVLVGLLLLSVGAKVVYSWRRGS